MLNAHLIRSRRKELGLSQQALADKLGVAQQLIGQLERGEVKTTKMVFQLARVLQLPLEELDPEIPAATARQEVPLAGYVGAGAVIYPMDAFNEMVEAPPGGATATTIAVIVRGDSMYPVYNDGDTIFYDRHQDPAELVGKECVVELRDGRSLVKILRRGSSPGLWSLFSHNAAPIEDVVLLRCAKVAWVRRA